LIGIAGVARADGMARRAGWRVRMFASTWRIIFVHEEFEVLTLQSAHRAASPVGNDGVDFNHLYVDGCPRRSRPVGRRTPSQTKHRV